LSAGALAKADPALRLASRLVRRSFSEGGRARVSRASSAMRLANNE